MAVATRPRIGRRPCLGAEDEGVADALVLIALGLRAGLPLVDALRHVRAGDVDADGTGSVGGELAAVVAALEWGLSTREAWSFAGPGWRAAAVATQLSEQTGAAAADLLEQASVRVREQRERASERAAARAGVLLVLPLGLGFLPAFACTAVVPVVATLAAGVLGAAP
ncbi:Type II secretion system (T2SS), protein F [Pedococcus dokdonensis]|uniref:Type II secretion system (T2SS), protein F n=2 Tax=Pedococcus dokdonensis TaxID=443156 RepID=A0A1H0UNI1_9MICO|nr:Type II secretion system (T2SS), protein F [Pedococcus dokdonensis]